VVRQARFASAFTFQYSKRPGRRPPRWTASCPRRSCRSATCG
jgi:tRNA-2-methylthio-N6-dimethylallyladenosine synthase